MRAFLCSGLAVAVCAGLVLSSIGQAPVAGKDDKDVLQPLEKLVKAFNARDAKSLAAAWSEKGEYLSEDTGERLEGRAAIEKDYAETFSKAKEIRLEVDINKIRRIGADVASIEGIARVIRPKETISKSQFVALLVKENGVWLIDSVRESRLAEPDSNAAFIEELNWLNGIWQHKDGDTEVTLECDEVANGNFRAHKFQIKS
ncbi:MAG TPA: SgcJ/EcaC family oxidoreductase, partial [Gemmataceae bacterium]|nr:SgcJ/EcaC family oxidoreductase [Gemmataceae bacterium]